MSETRVEPGAELFSVATGRLSIWRKRSRQAVDFMGALDGLVAVHQVADGRLLWLFATENDAKRGRNDAQAAGIECGRNICRWTVAADGVPEFDAEWALAHGMKGE